MEEEEVLEIRKREWGPTHDDTVESMDDLAGSYRSLGRTEDSVKLNEDILEIRKWSLRPKHPRVLESMTNLTAVYTSLGRTKEAANLNKEIVEIRRSVALVGL
jgi:Tetratricopeptide repeat